MATDLTSTTFSSTYRDDWTEDDNYHRILFNNGRALQARELTQMQTIIQEELGRFGKHIFKEGAQVNGQEPFILEKFAFVKIASFAGVGSFEDIPVGTTIQVTGGSPSTKAEVLEAKTIGSDDVLYIQYTHGNNALNTVFADGASLQSSDASITLTAEGTNATGFGVKYIQPEGDFFVLNHFVHVEEQSLIISSFSDTVDAVIGFKVEEKIITVSDDNDLYDNAANVVNTASPGADRYQITLTLINEVDIVAGENFVFLARIENSTIVETSGKDDYNVLADTLATRTREESGNYVVEPFIMTVDEGVVDSSLDVSITDGIGYVNGYRTQPGPTLLKLPKPTATETFADSAIAVNYGNYFVSDAGQSLPAYNVDLDLRTATGYGGSTIGTAKVRQSEEDGANTRFYMYDVRLNSATADIGTVRSVGENATSYFDLDLAPSGGRAALLGAGQNSALYELPSSRPKSINDGSIRMVVQRGELNIQAVQDGSDTTVTVSNPTDGTLTAGGRWVVRSRSNPGATESGYNVSGGEIRWTGDISRVNDFFDVHFFVALDIAGSTSRTKNLTTTTIASGSLSVDDAGNKYLPLGVPDIYEVDSVRLTNSSGPAADDRFRLDNGQRDNYYLNGRLYLDSAFSWDGTVYTSFKNFTRSTTGTDRFYSVNSYPAAVAYGDIPDHQLADGTIINLRDYIDMRPDVDESGNATNTFDYAENQSTIAATQEYYLARADKVLLTQDGNIQILMGQQSRSPQFKQTPDNSLELYKIMLNPNTLDEQDLTVTPMEHKRYTMKDIAKIEEKLDALEEFTTLSLLELESKIDSLFDSAGNARPEAGIVTDDQGDQRQADTLSGDYCASLDPDSKMYRPCFDEDNVRLVYDASLNPVSNGVTLKGDNVYLAYDSAGWKSQISATGTRNINPYGANDATGCIVLSPTSDEWKDSKHNAFQVVGGGAQVDRQQAFLWNNWQWNWFGRASEDIHVEPDEFSYTGEQGAFGRRRMFRQYRAENSSPVVTPRRGANGRFVTRVLSNNTVRYHVGNRAVDLALIPWIRSRKIYFHAKGLKPNTKHTPFFDGQTVSAFCREESFQRWSSRTDDAFGYNAASFTAHPDGTSDLISDANGEIQGSFFIPNVRPFRRVRVNGIAIGEVPPTTGYRYRAGVKEFKLLDVAENDITSSTSKAIAYYTVRGAIQTRSVSVLNTRFLDFAGPIYGVGSPVVYTPRETAAQIDGVSNSYVRVEEPHLSGQWGPNTGALTDVSPYNGRMGDILNDYISVNQLYYGGSNVNIRPTPHKVFAETFYVDNQFGVTLTNVKLYFAGKPSASQGQMPVSIEIRPMVNGAPSQYEIVPGSCVFKNPGDVNVPATAPTTNSAILSDAATDFEFEEPVYLNPWTSYALVIKSASTNYEVYTDVKNAYIIGSSSAKRLTGETNVGQPTSGRLFLPTSGPVYLPQYQENTMYQLRRAKFSPVTSGGLATSGQTGGANGSLILRNANIPTRLLDVNPIEVDGSTGTVYVKHPNHGLSPGDLVIISGVDAAVGGIASSNINCVAGDGVTVNAVDLNGFTFTAKNSDTSSSATVGGGEEVLCGRNIQFDYATPYMEAIVPPFTSLDFSAKFTSGLSIGDTTVNKYATQANNLEYERVVPRESTSFGDDPRVIANRDQETTSLSGNYSAYVKVDLKSGNDYVSPVIDLQRASLALVGNRIDNDNQIVNVSETSPIGALGSRHVATPIRLAQNAVGFQVKAKYRRYFGTEVLLYWRTATDGENINQKTWTEAQPVTPLGYTSRRFGQFKQGQWLIGGIGGELPPFSQVQTKFVFRSTKSGRVPAVKDIQTKLLAL